MIPDTRTVENEPRAGWGMDILVRWSKKFRSRAAGVGVNPVVISRCTEGATVKDVHSGQGSIYFACTELLTLTWQRQWKHEMSSRQYQNMSATVPTKRPWTWLLPLFLVVISIFVVLIQNVIWVKIKERVHLGNHPRQSEVGLPLVLVASSNICMNAREPHLSQILYSETFSKGTVDEFHKKFLRSCYHESFPIQRARTKFGFRPRQELGKHFQYNSRGLCRKIKTLWLTWPVDLFSPAIQFVEFQGNLKLGWSSLVPYFKTIWVLPTVSQTPIALMLTGTVESLRWISQWLLIIEGKLPYPSQFLPVHLVFGTGLVRKR